MKKYDFTRKDEDVMTAYHTERDSGHYSLIMKKYRDPATRYAFMVLEEKTPSCYKQKLDAFRHLQDLRRQNEDDDFNYHYDLEKARAIVNFAKLVPDPNAGRPLPLMLWQQAILVKIIAWRDVNNQIRYVRGTVSMSRTNGKTYLAAILIGWYFMIEGANSYNRNYLFVAPTTDQSTVGFGYLQTMFRKMKDLPGFKKLFKNESIAVLHDMIISRKLNNRIMRKSFESGQFDAFHCQFAVADEVGDDKHIGSIIRSIGKITSGQTQEPNHSFLQISTAYPDSNSQLYKDERLLTEIMEKDYDRSLDDNLCMVWEQDELNETEKPELWAKSNPLITLNDQKKAEMMKSLLSERDVNLAKGTLPDFQNKNLNMWLQVKQNTYLSLDDINHAIVPDAPIEIKGRLAYIGFDKSNFSDDTAVVFVFPYLDENENQRFYIQQHSWVPLARTQNNITIKEKQDGINYRHAEELGFADITKNDYGYIDDGAVFDWLMNFVEANQIDVKYFCYDKWGMSRIISWIEQKTNWNTMPVRNVIQNLNEPTIDLRKRFDIGQIKYQNDPIITYSLKNAVLFSNNNGVKVDKEKATTKIDFVDALIDAWYTAMYHFDNINLDKVDKKNPFSGMSADQINNYFTNDFSF